MHSLLMKKVIMYSSQTTHVFSSPLHCTIPKSSSFFLDAPVVRLHCLSGHGAKKKRLHFDIQQGRNAISKTHTPGISFLKENISMLEKDDSEHMLVGFEFGFPVLLDMARRLGIDVPDDSPFLQAIYVQRDLKLKRYWTKDGIFCTRNSRVHDVDDTAMGFRLLRLHGYEVHPGMQLCMMLVCVGFALDVPWYASMPRVEARFFIQHYGGEDDVWLDKALYRMPYVNNNVYLELAKLDYNYCQALHGTEWGRIQKWYEECKPRDFGISRECLLRAYFMAAASIFEPERSMERLAWAKTAILLEIIVSYFNEVGNSTEQRIAFTTEFSIRASPMGGYINGRKLDKIGTTQELIQMLLATIDQFSQDAFAAYDHDITRHLHNSWKMWLLKWQEEGDRWLGEAELVIQTINLMADHKIAEKLFMGHTNYEQLFSLTNKVCYSLGHHELQNNRELEHDMQRLVQLVLTNSSDGIDSDIKKTFLAVAKRFYYTAFVDPETVNVHIAKVLFERVD
ncbi:ent-kaurene synthase A family protein [Tripterygium wilfordii]|uniref:Ent-kaurene synthase A family protein n=1 Tax=Tripterygium wilfordii TaxID=458696 RepID=A0A7J7C232_TRIWF|nr:ent-kaurene synthase A family protein [Tripterygium wilfordii]